MRSLASRPKINQPPSVRPLDPSNSTGTKAGQQRSGVRAAHRIEPALVTTEPGKGTDLGLCGAGMQKTLVCQSIATMGVSGGVVPRLPKKGAPNVKAPPSDPTIR